LLTGKSRVIGTKFQPGGLRPFIDRPVAALTDRVVPIETVFGAAAADLGCRALAHTDHHAAIGVIESFLLERNPRVVDELELLRRITSRIASDREMRGVEPLAREFGLGMRSLQRLFREFVGVSPKWMIRRFRLQEATETLAAARRVDWAEFALGLGYTDQAHFVRDFKRLIGSTPGAYFKALADLVDV
jgi:AraC-like DNA-binding protein